MSSNTILIRNVYVMMAYAFRALQNRGVASVESESFDHLHDLLAELLYRGVSTQIKRGLHHDYLPRTETLTTVRGRIDVSKTASTRSMLRGRLVCQFDEYLSDTPHNRALKSVVVLLIRRGEVQPIRRKALTDLLPHFVSVNEIRPTAIRWGDLSIHRANASYRMLLGVCELIVKGLLPTEDPGRSKLWSWLSDEAMDRLYERFILQYFKIHHPELAPHARQVPWAYDTLRSSGTGQLPVMQTDVMLTSGDAKLIIDAKCYGRSLQSGRGEKQTVHSHNLYQIATYVWNADVHRDGSVSGLLLYARTIHDEQPDVDIVIHGNRIGVQTLDLNLPWEELRDRLETLRNWLVPTAH
ncbi:5-methylcytosine-specific restriction endonuclease system specificity protein McrC [Brevibacterium sediminis]|nr:5-methylcytosine-specific restriction endonuclease system specificity protein McrC [Brevibacterium sediminis]